MTGRISRSNRLLVEKLSSSTLLFSRFLIGSLMYFSLLFLLQIVTHLKFLLPGTLYLLLPGQLVLVVHIPNFIGLLSFSLFITNFNKFKLLSTLSTRILLYLNYI
jgi:hypothetical protein